MTGADEIYNYTPYFNSTIYDLKWEAISTLNPLFDILFYTREDESIVFYLDGDKIKDVLIWNLKVDLDDVRKIFNNPLKEKSELVGLLNEQK